MKNCLTYVLFMVLITNYQVIIEVGVNGKARTNIARHKIDIGD